MSQWTLESLRSRIKDPASRLRHPAGSPCPEEIAAYERCLGTRGRNLAVVLGMTPELRRLAGALFDRVVSVDHSEHAIALYGNWVPADVTARETVVLGDWLELREHVDTPADVILGDGVFPNLHDRAAHLSLLRESRAVLRPGGVLVTRHLVIPRWLEDSDRSWRQVRDRHRAGELDDAEFGFATRFLGHLGCCYDSKRRTLDNSGIFEETARAHAGGDYTDAERTCIERYRFDGDNLLLPEADWDALVAADRWLSHKVELRGRDWYRYYPVYVLTPLPG